jgi:hypothetical protein
MNERFELLIQLELDGEISERELAELDSACQEDPATREYRTRMLELGQDLDTLAWREPSADLKHRVLQELGIGAPRRPAPAPRPRWRMDFRQAAAFAAGIALVLVAGRFAPLFPDSAVNGDHATGTLLTGQNPTEEFDRGRMQSGGTEIEAWTEGSDGRVFLRARGTGEPTTPVRIEWTDPEWSVVAVRSVPPAILGVDRGRAHIAWTRSGQFTLELELQAGNANSGVGDVRLFLGEAPDAGPSITLDVTP